MQTQDLGGKWELRQGRERKTIAASVPGCVHMDLLAARAIPDPFFGDNEDALQWIGKAEWTYSRSFEVARGLLDHQRVLLVCEGLDTLATIRLNGRLVAQTANMFCTWEFDVKALLHAGTNTIEVRFASAEADPPPAANAPPDPPPAANAPPDPHADHRFKPFARKHLRKEACNYGWDWGPKLVTCGIWRPIRLVAFDTARLEDVHIVQRHSPGGGVALEVAVEAGRLSDEPLRARITLSRERRIICEKLVSVTGARVRARIAVPDPQLWWPRGMGAQPLYEVRVELVARDGAVLDSQSRRIGLRTLTLRRRKDEWGESFEFVANGVAFFAKGANWIPADVFAPRVTRADYERLVGDAAAANMNMLRVWGGGIYEEDVFYDLCDEQGICVWQDFMFACATYPAYDDDWMRGVEAEARDNIRRLRHHPSIALWCGNNEVELSFFIGEKWDAHHMTWEDYGKLFDRLLPELVKELDPGRDYWPGSPHSPCGDRMDSGNPACGDAHLWDVWHGRRPFEWYRTATHRFVSEFGFQSFPEPRTVRSFTRPEDRNVVSRIMEHHQRSDIGNSTILTYMLDWFRLPPKFDDMLWLSQILQGMAMKYAVEHWRRLMPRCMGSLYWQFNDCWPVASWASIDSLGRWKALHYMARRFYAPMLVSGVENLKRGEVAVFVTSDLIKPVSGSVTWRVVTVGGETLATGAKRLRIQPGKSAPCGTVPLAKHLKTRNPRDLIVSLALEVGGKTVSDNLVLLARPKHMDLEKPSIKTRVRAANDGAYIVRLETDKPALWTWLQLGNSDASYSDSFFALLPGAAKEVTVTPANSIGLAVFRRQLKIRSLADTY